jgi:hypothetical protein
VRIERRSNGAGGERGCLDPLVVVATVGDALPDNREIERDREVGVIDRGAIS